MAREVTVTGGREATTRYIAGDCALCVGEPRMSAPPGWTWHRLADIARLESGHTPSRRHADYWGGDIPWMGLRDAKAHHGSHIFETAETTNTRGISNSSARVLPAGTVCLSRTASVGYVVIMGRDMATSQDFVNWTCSDKLEPRFLQYLLIAEGMALKRFAAGAVHPTIYYPEVKAFHVCVPHRSEQKRIVAILDEAFVGIDKAIANTEKNLANTRELFERTVADNLFGRQDQEGWSLITVADAAASRKGSIRTGPFGSQLLHSEFVEEGIAVLGIDNAVENKFTWGKRRYITSSKYAALARYTVFPGDVLITIMGTCGRCAVVPDDIPTAINTKHLCCITLDHAKCLPDYLHAYFLFHPLAKAYLQKHAKGAIMAGLNMGLIQELPLAVPSIDRQREIANAIATLRDQVSDLQVAYDQKLRELTGLKQSLLAKAFLGELSASDSLAEAAE